jgi:hypothetical protein
MIDTRKTALALLLVFAGAARAQDQDPKADAAAAELLASKALATVKVPPEQWVGSYSGSCWTGTLRLAVVDHDEAAAGLRRIEIERIVSRDKEKPEREVEKWWIDAAGLVVRGERSEFDAGEEEPKSALKFEVKGGKLVVHEEDVPPDPPAELHASFVPDKLMALLFVPESQGKRWRFSTLVERDEFTAVTIEDMGKEMVTARAGDVSARKLKVSDRFGEATFWLDDQHRIVAARWPNLYAVGGTEEEARADWWSRSPDDADKEADRLAAGPAKLEATVGSLTYGIYDDKGHLESKVTSSIVKENKDDKPAFHYVASTADVGSNAATAREEWWLAPDGSVLSAAYKLTDPGKESAETKLKVEGDKMTCTATNVPAGKEDVTLPVPPRLRPDALFLVKPALEAKAPFRFHCFDLVGRYTYALLFTPKGEEDVELPDGTKMKARRVDLAQNIVVARIWVDASSNPVLVIWENGEVQLFRPLDKLPPSIQAAAPADKDEKEDKEEKEEGGKKMGGE